MTFLLVANFTVALYDGWLDFRKIDTHLIISPDSVGLYARSI